MGVYGEWQSERPISIPLSFIWCHSFALLILACCYEKTSEQIMWAAGSLFKLLSHRSTIVNRNAHYVANGNGSVARRHRRRWIMSEGRPAALAHVARIPFAERRMLGESFLSCTTGYMITRDSNGYFIRALYFDFYVRRTFALIREVKCNMNFLIDIKEIVRDFSNVYIFHHVSLIWLEPPVTVFLFHKIY